LSRRLAGWVAFPADTMRLSRPDGNTHPEHFPVSAPTVTHYRMKPDGTLRR